MLLQTTTKQGRHAYAAFLPELEDLGVVAVEGFECDLQLHRQAEGVEGLGLASALLGHAVADVLPQVAEGGSA